MTEAEEKAGSFANSAAASVQNSCGIAHGGLMATNSSPAQTRYIRLRGLASFPNAPGRLPLSGNSIWRLVREGRFPKPIKLSAGCTAWLLADVERWEAQQAEVK